MKLVPNTALTRALAAELAGLQRFLPRAGITVFVGQISELPLQAFSVHLEAVASGVSAFLTHAGDRAVTSGARTNVWNRDA